MFVSLTTLPSPLPIRCNTVPLTATLMSPSFVGSYFTSGTSLQ